MQLYVRLDAAGRPDEADEWLRRDIEAGETSSLWLLASRVEQAGNAVEAAALRQRALEAGEWMVLQPALQQIKQAEGTLAEYDAPAFVAGPSRECVCAAAARLTCACSRWLWRGTSRRIIDLLTVVKGSRG
ncbi:MAG TPA: hypothetical protein VMA72_17175 [Streptosporangiaceae bacterium]|nr:hypothetical protein [Streptosporangiaceae bacterium]